MGLELILPLLFKLLIYLYLYICGWLIYKYSNNEKAIRINLLIDKLTNIPENIKELFEDEYPQLLDELKAVLVKRDSVIEDTRFIKKSNNWWEY